VPHVAFDLNPFRVSAAIISAEHPVIYGDGASRSVLAAAGVFQPRSIVVTYSSVSRRVDAVLRLRQAFPGSPIYVCVHSRSESTAQEETDLYAAGATGVLRETTEVARRFGTLLGCSPESVDQRLGDRLVGASELDFAGPELRGGWENTPFTREELESLAAQAGVSLQEVLRLYDIFAALDVDGNGELAIDEVRQALAGADGTGSTVNEDTLREWYRKRVAGTVVGDSGGGSEPSSVTFFDFARIALEGTMDAPPGLRRPEADSAARPSARTRKDGDPSAGEGSLAMQRGAGGSRSRSRAEDSEVPQGDGAESRTTASQRGRVTSDGTSTAGGASAHCEERASSSRSTDSDSLHPQSRGTDETAGASGTCSGSVGDDDISSSGEASSSSESM